MTEPEGGKGPYFAANFGGSCQVVRVNWDGNSVYGWLFSIEDGPCAADLANSAYAAGFKAGRAGRDNLREAMESARKTIAGVPMSLGYHITSLPEIDKALSADGEVGK